eukprot:2459757-Rhodomonas_salina.2
MFVALARATMVHSMAAWPAGISPSMRNTFIHASITHDNTSVNPRRKACMMQMMRIGKQIGTIRNMGTMPFMSFKQSIYGSTGERP